MTTMKTPEQLEHELSIERTTAAVAEEIVRGRHRAHAKHGPDSIEGIDASDPRWLSILVEEVGEAATELTYDATGSLRAELLDVATVAVAWLAAIDRADATPGLETRHPSCAEPARAIMHKLTGQDFTTVYRHDDAQPYPFVELGEEGQYVVGLGHIDPKSFAAALTDFDSRSTAAWYTDEATNAADVQHLYAVQVPTDDGWMIEWVTDGEPVTADRVGAFPITMVSR